VSPSALELGPEHPLTGRRAGALADGPGELSVRIHLVQPQPQPILILVLSLAGTVAFGLSGWMAAVRARLDVFGVAVLAVVVALSGGIIRDLLIGRPPQAFRDWRYIAAAAATGLVCFFFWRTIERLHKAVQVFDALGLALFCVTGASAALAAGIGPALATVLGAI
jgi:uncharacterized membrane protein YeiH